MASITLAIVAMALLYAGTFKFMKESRQRKNEIGVVGLLIALMNIAVLFSGSKNPPQKGMADYFVFAGPPAACFLAASGWGWYSLPLPVLLTFTFLVTNGHPEDRIGYQKMITLIIGVVIFGASLLATFFGLDLCERSKKRI